ncbi:hypothetical protein JVU11DRAFT_8880 [Chiua virens]|nr:hypothetical protein JVU11DRAFT_8880 [Chiua virens]
MACPICKNTNVDPTAIIQANTQKCCTTAQKNADEAHEVVAAAKVQDQVAKERREKVLAIVAMEDQPQDEDDTYLSCTRTSTKRGAEGDRLGPDDDMQMEPTTDPASESEYMNVGSKESCGKNPRALCWTYAVAQIDSNESKGDDGGNAEHHNQPKSSFNATCEKPHSLHEDIGNAWKTAPTNNTVQKQVANPANSDLQAEGNELPTPKRLKKGTQFASNLSKDWKKKINHTKGVGATQTAQIAPMSRKDKAAVTLQVSAPRTLLIPKQIKEADCQWINMIEWHGAAQKARKLGSSGMQESEGGGNLAAVMQPTKSMDLKVSKANVNHMLPGMEVAQGPGVQLILKALRDMKVKDLPIENTLLAKHQWDILISC